ncbi:SpoIIE family protein phosphatase [Kineococcus indalonis]|uniref:SpoIIE family protein phosphatase n=1 Tax=Kineococcus indalonis TaxID=2696566 RepID=UPI0014120F07|nr:SpoIIE family protein phosphatase [Kineococcus indalonis]NAZ87821.1 SpoIIE family protein phosphatase [Kineococcus indalonis]
MHLQQQDLRLFHALPTAHLLLRPDLTIVRANPAYARLVGVPAPQLTGRHLLQVLAGDAAEVPVGGAGPAPDDAPDDRPDDRPDDAQGGVARLRRSLHRALATGEADVLPAERYPVIDLRTGLVGHRWWSSVVVPVLDGSGRVELLIQRVEDITAYVEDRGARQRQLRAEEQWQARALSAETELFARAREAQAAREGERARARELAALAEATVQVSTAEDVEQLTEVLITRALGALGAQGGAVAVRQGDRLRLSITASLGQEVQLRYAELSLDDPLPAAVVSATGRRVLLHDRAETVAYGDGAAEIVATTGCQAWACLPLGAGGAVVGALLIGWRQAQIFSPASLEVLEAFAAQCAQALVRIWTHQSQRAEAAQTSELALALQRALLSEPARPDGLEVLTRYRPAVRSAQVGGDWYDSFVSAAGTTTLVVGDVVGHDREAAAAMGQVRSMLRALAYTTAEPPAATLRLLDQTLHGLHLDLLASVVLVGVHRDEDPGDPGAARYLLRWSNAGHPPPLLVHPDGRAELLRTDAELLVGLEPSTARRDHRVALDPGAVLLLYTDGLIERRGCDLDDGLDWLARTVSGIAGGTVGGGAAGTPPRGGGGPPSLARLCDTLLELVEGHADDDVVLLALRA